MVYVNEIHKNDGVGAEYNDMALGGIYLNSGQEFTSLIRYRHISIEASLLKIFTATSKVKP